MIYALKFYYSNLILKYLIKTTDFLNIKLISIINFFKLLIFKKKFYFVLKTFNFYKQYSDNILNIYLKKNLIEL